MGKVYCNERKKVPKGNVYIESERGKYFALAKPISSKERYYLILDKRNY